MNLGSNHGIMTPLFALEDWEKIMIYVIKCEQGWFECDIINNFTPFSLWCFYIPLVRTLTHIFSISKFFYLFILIPNTFSIDLEKNPWPPWFHSRCIHMWYPLLDIRNIGDYDYSVLRSKEENLFRKNRRRITRLLIFVFVRTLASWNGTKSHPNILQLFQESPAFTMSPS